MSDRTAEPSEMKGHPVDGFANDLNFPYDMNANFSSFSCLSALLMNSHNFMITERCTQLV